MESSTQELQSIQTAAVLVAKEPTKRPRTLEEARANLLNLPGAGNYVKDRSVPALEIDKCIDVMIQEGLYHIQAQNETALIRQNMGWSDAEASTFFANPDRVPFRSQIEFSESFDGKVNQFSMIGDYLKLRYAEAKLALANVADGEKSERARELQQAKDRLRNLYMDTLNNLYAKPYFEYDDKVNGINPEDRKTDNITIAPDLKKLFTDEISKVSQEFGVDKTGLEQEVSAATEDMNLQTIRVFLETYKGRPEVRRVLERVWSKRMKDPELQQDMMQLLWAAESYRHALGIDMELFLELFDYPPGNVLETKLHEFMVSPDDNTLVLLDHEAPELAKVWREQGTPMDYFKFLDERANNRNLPDTVSTVDQIRDKEKKVTDRLRRIIPIAFEDPGISFVGSAIKRGAQFRGISINYRNKDGLTVNTVIQNPRTSEPQYAVVKSHEIIGHQLHKRILVLAEKAGYVDAGSIERVSSPIKEEFALLAEGQIRKIWEADESATQTNIQTVTQPQRVAPPSGRWPNALNALLMRRQAPYGLTQRAVRMELDRIWNSGRRDISRPEANGVVEKFQPQVDLWFAEGVPMVFPNQSLSFNVSPLAPHEGPNYIRKYLSNNEAKQQKRATEELQEPKEESVTMEEAFEERWGTVWILNKDARVTYLALLAETGKNAKSATYGEFVRTANIDELRLRLQQLGISDELVGETIQLDQLLKAA